MTANMTSEKNDEIRVESKELAELEALSDSIGEENLSSWDGDEGSKDKDDLQMAQEQSMVVCTLDSLAGDIHTCGRCKDIFLEVHMHVVMNGPWRNNWVCVDEEKCAFRETGSTLGQRKRKANPKFDEGR